MKDNVVRVGIIGLGGAGRAHIRYFSACEGASVVAVFDPKRSSLQSALEESGLAGALATTDVEEFLSCGDMNAISICAPDQYHLDYCLRALETGRHILCEKPVVTSEQEADRLLKVADASELVFAAFHQLRFDRTFRRAFEAVRMGDVGDVFCIEGDYVHDLTDRAGRYDSWRLDGPHGQPPHLGGGVHFMDLFFWLLGQELEEVFSHANNLAFPRYPEADCVMTTMKFANGCIGRVLTTFGCKCPQSFRLRVFGTRGTIVNNVIFRGEELHRITWARPWRMAKKEKAVDWLTRKIKSPRFREYPFYMYDHYYACVKTVEDFVRTVREGGKPSSDVRAGIRAAVAAAQATDSYRLGSPIRPGQTVAAKTAG